MYADGDMTDHQQVVSDI